MANRVESPQPRSVESLSTESTPPVSAEAAEDLIHRLIQVMREFEERYALLARKHDELQAAVQRLSRDLEKRNEELNAALHEQQRLHHSLRSIVNSLHDGVIAVDLECRITLFNRRAAELTGKLEQEVLGRRYADCFPEHPPILWETLRRQQPQVEEFQNYLGGSSRRQIEVTTALVRDDQGNLLGALEVLRDLTERREMEAQLQRARMLAALGEMAVKIAHDIRNPLGAIQLRAEMLRDGGEGDPTTRQKAFDTIFSAIKLMDTTIGNLLQFSRFSRSGEVATEYQNLTPLLDQALSLAEHAVRLAQVQVVRQYPALGLMAHVDGSRFLKAVLNVILNAVQAMEKAPKRVLTVAARRWEGNEPGVSCPFGDRPWVEVAVQDTGCGMSPETLEQIFTPFFTTKDHGVGLGLSIVHHVVEVHGGTIRVDSQEGVGTTFRILLPVYRPGRLGAPAS